MAPLKSASLHDEDTTAVLEKAMEEKKNGSAGLNPNCSRGYAALQPGHSEKEHEPHEPLPDDVVERQALGFCMASHL